MSLTPCNKWLARVSDAAQQALLPAQATLAAPAAHAHEAERESQQAQAPAAQRRHGLNGQANSEVAVRKRVNSVMAQFKKNDDQHDAGWHAQRDRNTGQQVANGCRFQIGNQNKGRPKPDWTALFVV